MVHSAAATCASRFAGPRTVTGQRSRVRARWVPEQSQMPQQRPLLNLARASEYLGDRAGFEPLHRFPKGHQPTEGLDHLPPTQTTCYAYPLTHLLNPPTCPARCAPTCSSLGGPYRSWTHWLHAAANRSPDPRIGRCAPHCLLKQTVGEFLVIRGIVRLWVTWPQ
jgi:hypothetical protein